MRKKAIFILSMLMISCLTLIGGIGNVSVDAATVLSSPQTYGLYTSDNLVSARDGKKYIIATKDEAVIKRSDGSRETTDESLVSIYRTDGTPQFNTWKDSNYAYNAGNIGTTPDDTTMYQMLGNSEIFFEGYTGGEIGAEWILSETIDIADYFALSFDVAYGFFGRLPNGPATGDTEGESWVYVYGTGKDGNTLVQSQKVTFGIDYYSTGVLEFSDDFSSISRIAVSVLYQSVTYQQDDRYILVTGFTVHSRENSATEKLLSANEMDMDFYNGLSISGAFGGTSQRVFWANGAYAGNFSITGENYCYGTQRISVGSFITLKLKNPIKASEYKYMDVELYASAAQAEGDWLAETSENYYISVLKGNATDLQTETIFKIKKYQWATCRIVLADFADENGYVNNLVFYYSDNDADRVVEEESKYAIHLGINDITLTNYAAKEMLVYYVESPTITESEVSMNLKTSYSFAYTDEPAEKLAEGIVVNGSSIATLITENKAKLTFDGNYIKLTVDKALFKMDDTDTIKVQNGTEVCGELAVKETEIFTYYATLDRFELETDVNAERKSQISLEQVEMGTVDEQYRTTGMEYAVTENSIFVTFPYTVCHNWKASKMLASMDEMALLTGSSEDYVYELAKQGVLKSCMDLLYLNGRSVRDWLRIDREAGLEGLIWVEFLGDGFNSGKALRVMAAKESNLKLGVGLDMSIEFKAGFVTPMNQYIAKDMYCSIAAADAVGGNSLFTISDETERDIVNADGNYKNNDEKTGCSGSIIESGAGIFIALTVSAVILIVKRKQGGCR